MFRTTNYIRPNWQSLPLESGTIKVVKLLLHKLLRYHIFCKNLPCLSVRLVFSNSMHDFVFAEIYISVHRG